MPFTKPKTLAFNKAFKCHSCTNCCRDWQVPVREPEYLKLKDILTQKHGAEHVDEFMERVSNDINAFARFKLKANGACIFLNEVTKLCNLQNEFGPTALPAVCRTFPRQLVETHDDRVYAYDYTLSATCPTALDLLNTPNACRIESDLNYDTQFYNSLRISSATRTLTLPHRPLEYAAYELFKNHASEFFNDMRLTVEETLIRVGLLLGEIWTSQGEVFTAQEMTTLLDKNIHEPPEALDKRISAVPCHPALHFRSTGAWLKMRGNYPVQEVAMQSLIARYGRNEFSHDEVTRLTEAYHTHVKPLMAAQHWMLRNTLAAKIFFNPDVLLYDSASLPFVLAFVAYSLIRLLLLDQALSGTPLEPQSLAHALKTVEYSLVHFRKMEQEFASVIAANRIAPQAILPLIKLT